MKASALLCHWNLLREDNHWNYRHLFEAHSMMTWSTKNIFRVTGHLRVEFTGHLWIPLTKASAQSFDVFFDLHLNKRLSKQLRGWWFEMPLRPLWLTVMSVIISVVYYISFETITTNSFWTLPIFIQFHVIMFIIHIKVACLLVIVIWTKRYCWELSFERIKIFQFRIC